MSAIISPPPGHRIGLLGGSFNPAHDGHLHISEQAIELLNLDRVIWLVSPQNPLKSDADMAPFAERMAHAEHVARHNPKIIVSDVENRLGTVYTAETLREYTGRFPKIKFAWLMGADNMLQIDQWKDWDTIFRTLPIVVFARPRYSDTILSSTAALQFGDSRVEASQGGELLDMAAPAWVYLETPMHPESGTRLRSQN